MGKFTQQAFSKRKELTPRRSQRDFPVTPVKQVGTQNVLCLPDDTAETGL